MMFYHDVLVCETLQSYMKLYLWVVIECAGRAGPLACGRVWRERIGSGLITSGFRDATIWTKKDPYGGL